MEPLTRSPQRSQPYRTGHYSNLTGSDYIKPAVFSLFALFISLLCLFSSPTFAWGQNGHRIIGQIASNHLTETTRKAVNALLAGESLAQVSTWADEMRSNPAEFWQKESGRWHYINLNKPDDFAPDQYSLPQSRTQIKDIYGATLKAIAILQDKQAHLSERQFYLRFLVHLIGDMHQPLHAGHGEDRGGNDIHLTLFNEPTNLHAVWDTGLIESQNLSYSEFSQMIDTNNPDIIHQYLESSPADWLRESIQLSDNIYKSASPSLSYNYVYQELPLVKQRLRQAGIRLAGLLNRLFDPQAKKGSQAITELPTQLRN